MKKIGISIMAFAALAILLMAPAAQAYLAADIRYSETDLGGGLWQYDYVFKNTSSIDDAHPNLQRVELNLGGDTTVNVLNMPMAWTSYTFTGTVSVGTPVVTDYLEMYSDMPSADVLAGSLLGGFRFTSDYMLGNLNFEAVFSDHAGIEDFSTISGTTSAVPIPAAVWLLGSGLAGLVGIRRRLGR